MKPSAAGTEVLKYQKLIDFIINNIRHGIYPDGSQLPSESTLAEAAKVSRATVRESLRQLCERGIIVKQQGRRSTVNAKALPGRARPLRFAWISRNPFAQVGPVYLEIYSALQKAVLGINAELVFLPMLNPREEAWVESLLDSFDGIFLAGVRASSLIPGLAERLRNTPNSIEIDDIGDTPAACSVCTDNYRAGQMAADYLIDHKRHVAAFISNRSSWYLGFHDRARGLIDGFARRKQPLTLAQCDDGFNTPAELHAQLAGLLKEHPEIDTIWHASDGGALIIRKAFEQIVPQRADACRSIGVDGVDECSIEDPRHASLKHPTAEIARKAFQTMLNFSAGQQPEQRVCYLEPTLLPWRCDNC